MPDTSTAFANGVNFAAKYATQIDRAFTQKSLVANATNQDYKFDGVNKVVVFSINNMTMGDYTMSGASRYGSPTEIGNAAQELQITQDKKFNGVIDKRSNLSTNGVMNAAAALRQQIDEVCVPTYDSYVLTKLASGAPSGNTQTVTVTANNAFSEFLLGQNALGNAKVPTDGRVAFISYEYYSYLKQSKFVLDSDAGQKTRFNGEIGTADGVHLIVVPSSTMPTNTHVILTHRSACVAPKILEHYKIHTDPPGINGWLIEGRFLFDAFVLNKKKTAIYVIKSSSGG